MEGIQVNTIIENAQHRQNHIEVSDGHLICWESKANNSIAAQKFGLGLEKIGNEFTIADQGAPCNAELFKTEQGFGVIFNKNDGQIYVKTYDINCNVIVEERMVNTLRNYGIQNTDQKIGIEINNGYLIVWSGPIIPAGNSEIHAQKIDYNSDPIGDQFLINDSDEYSKYNPAFTYTDFGFIICWGKWCKDSDEKWGNQITLKKYDNNCLQIDNQQIVNNALTIGARHNKLRRFNNGYLILWQAGYTNVFVQKLTNELELIGDYLNISGSNFRGSDSINNEFGITRYHNSEVYFQRYDLDGVKIDDEITISDDPNNEFYDDGAIVSSIMGGYFVIYNSTKLNNNYEIYVKQFIYEDVNIGSAENTLLIDNNYRITILKNNINNLLQDVRDIEEIQLKIDNWISKGIDLNNSKEPLENQKKLWNEMIDKNIEFLKNNFLELKKHDDRITNSTNVIFDDTKYNGLIKIEKLNYLCLLYDEIHINIKEDINKLNYILEGINQYTNLGVKLGNANQLINEQLNTLENAIKTASINFDNLLKTNCKEIEIIKINN